MVEEGKQSLMTEKGFIDILVTNMLPTTKYIETRFDMMQNQIDEVKSGLRDVKEDIKALESRFDKRFEQVDKRFEQVDKRFEDISNKLDKLIERIDIKIDNGLKENRALTIRMFTFAMTFAAISMVGLFGKLLRLF